MDPIDAASGLAKAGLNLVPGGSFVASLVGDFIPTQHQKRFERFSKEVENRVARLERRVSEEQFGFLFEKAARVAISDHRQYKTKVLASLLAAASKEILDIAEDRIMIDMVDELEDRHIQVLGILPRPSNGGRASEVQAWTTYPDIEKRMQGSSPERKPISVAILLTCLTDLIQAGVLECEMMDEHAGHIIMKINPRGLMKMQKYRLAPLGHRFVVHLQAAGV